MCRAKRLKRTSFRRAMRRNMLAILVVCLSAITIGTTLAVLIKTTDKVENTFERANVSCEIIETFDRETKTNVMVKNTSVEDNVSGYIRVALIVNWEDEFGNVHGTDPVAGVDYSISCGAEWKQDTNGYYYWPNEVKPNECTGIFIEECKPLKDAPEGYTLVVDILTEIIQSNPVEAVKSAWGYVPGMEGE